MQMTCFFRLGFLWRSLVAGLWLGSGLLVASCGGGGGGDNGSGTGTTTATVQQGVFIDSAVAGLIYRTASRSGETEGNGAFRYLTGEQVSFFIGDLKLGQAQGQSLISPLTLVPDADDINNSTVTNISRLLQSLDADGNLANGILLPSVAHSVSNGRSIDFSQQPDAFSNDPEVFDLFDALNAQNAFSDGPRSLVSAAQARSHLQDSLGLNGGDGNSDCSPEDIVCVAGESLFETNLRSMINSYRSQSNLAALNLSVDLYQLAEQHSVAMEAADFLSHDGFQQRYQDSGFRTCVENVAWNYQTPESLLAGWQNSSGHDQNLLNAHINYVGLSRVGNYTTFFACGDY